MDSQKINSQILNGIRNRNFWEEYGVQNNFNKLQNWRSLKFLWSDLTNKKDYFSFFLSQDPEEMQKDVGDSLSATSIISVLILSITSSVLDYPSAIKENNLFGAAAEFFSYSAQVAGILSFIFAIFGTLFSVLFYSAMIRVPSKCFPAFLQAVGEKTFTLIWILPTNSLYFYLITIILRVALSSGLGIGIFALCSTVIILAYISITLQYCDIVQALTIIVTRKCQDEIKIRENQQNGMALTEFNQIY